MQKYFIPHINKNIQSIYNMYAILQIYGKIYINLIRVLSIHPIHI